MRVVLLPCSISTSRISRAPDVSLEKGPIAGKVAGAVLLSLLNPFAALIPFVDTGAPDSAENANKTGCYDLAARSKAQREKN